VLQYRINVEIIFDLGTIPLNAAGQANGGYLYPLRSFEIGGRSGQVVRIKGLILKKIKINGNPMSQAQRHRCSAVKSEMVGRQVKLLP
jgi:hypothetical protein